MGDGNGRLVGAEFSRSFAGRGLNVILIARRVERVEAVAAELEQKNSLATHVIQADLMRARAASEVGAALPTSAYASW